MTDEQLRIAAKRSYSNGHDRDAYLPKDLNASRDEAFKGTWIDAAIWIPDEDIR